MAIVYQHRRLDNNDVFYVGIGKTKDRAYSKKSRNKHWKYIVELVNYEVDILIEGCTIEEAKEVEIGLIKSIGRSDLKLGSLCNMTDGGDGTINHSPETISSIKDKLRGCKRSEESKNKQRSSRVGKKCDQPTKEKISKSNKGRGFSKEHRLKLSLSKKNKTSNVTKAIEQLDKNFKLIASYLSTKDAFRKTNISVTSINNNLKNRSKTAGGYIWKYK